MPITICYQAVLYSVTLHVMNQLAEQNTRVFRSLVEPLEPFKFLGRGKLPSRNMKTANDPTGRSVLAGLLSQ